MLSSPRMLAVRTLLRLMFAIGQLLKSVPFLRCFVIRAFDLVSGDQLPPDTYWDALFGKEMMDNVWHSIVIDLHKLVKIGGQAPNPLVVTPDGKHSFPLLDKDRGRPLVLNFGSCTCPIFMNRLTGFRELVAEFGHVADFLVVYIEEAHPSDGWALKENYQISTHRSQIERCAASCLLNSQDPGCEVVVDTMTDAANRAYGAMPIRLSVVEHGKMVYDSGPGPKGYRLQDLRSWLQQLTIRRAE